MQQKYDEELEKFVYILLWFVHFKTEEKWTKYEAREKVSSSKRHFEKFQYDGDDGRKSFDGKCKSILSPSFLFPSSALMAKFRL